MNKNTSKLYKKMAESLSGKQSSPEQVKKIYRQMKKAHSKASAKVKTDSLNDIRKDL
jgi:hypothetical protein